jgi:alcohol dehydrogenase class IV
MPANANWNYPTAIRFGAGRIVELPSICREIGVSRPMLVTDRGLADSAMMARAADLCASAGVPAILFAGVQTNPAGRDVALGVKAYREGGCDGVIAIGGGSALDVGKVIAFAAGQTRPLWDFEDIGDWWSRANAAAIAPVIAVPTTAGTGSEVGRAAVILDEIEQKKKIIFHPGMLPARVIADPELTVSLPPHLTAATGMDALSHALEAYCAPGFHPLADGIAVEAMRIVHDWLPRAVAHGDDIEARGQMLAAAAMGATAFQKGLGAMHALAHPIGALHHTHHGLTNAVLMPYVLAFNRKAIEPALNRLAAYLGLRAPGFDSVLDWTLALRAEFQIPDDLTALGVPDGDIARLAGMAAADPSAAGNPIVFDAPAARAVLEAAFAGSLTR